jgi:hypothetical protein
VRLPARGSDERVRAARAGADVVGGPSAAGVGGSETLGSCGRCDWADGHRVPGGDPLHPNGRVDPPFWRIGFPRPVGEDSPRPSRRYLVIWPDELLDRIEASTISR